MMSCSRGEERETVLIIHDGRSGDISKKTTAYGGPNDPFWWPKSCLNIDEETKRENHIAQNDDTYNWRTYLLFFSITLFLGCWNF